MPRPEKPKRGAGKSSKSQPLTWRKRREVVRNARHLDREIPRLLQKHKDKVSSDVLWKLADACRELRAYRKRPKAERNILRLAALVDNVDTLADKHLGNRRKSPRREYTESIVAALLIALFIRAFLFEPFKIPTGSMIPTLMVGDHIFVSKFIYGIRIPWTRVRLGGWRTAKRGEVIVFEYPGPGEHHGVDYIKRVMATAGDRVWMKNNLWHIRPKGSDDVTLAALSVRNSSSSCFLSPDEQCDGSYGNGCNCTFIEEHNDDLTWISQRISQDTMDVIQLTDVACTSNQQCLYEDGTGNTIRGQCVDSGTSRVCGVTQTVSNTPDWPLGSPPPRSVRDQQGWERECKRANSATGIRGLSRWDAWRFLCGWGDGGWGGPWNKRAPYIHEVEDRFEIEVPEGYLMVLGDNRDNSEDGRRWGLVSLDRIKGKALMLWWAGEDRWNRMFRKVH
jgi:signal peptidase I